MKHIFKWCRLQAWLWRFMNRWALFVWGLLPGPILPSIFSSKTYTHPPFHPIQILQEGNTCKGCGRSYRGLSFLWWTRFSSCSLFHFILFWGDRVTDTGRSVIRRLISSQVLHLALCVPRLPTKKIIVCDLDTSYMMALKLKQIKGWYRLVLLIHYVVQRFICLVHLFFGTYFNSTHILLLIYRQEVA